MKTALLCAAVLILLAGCASEHYYYLYAERTENAEHDVVVLDDTRNPAIQDLLVILKEKDLEVTGKRELILKLGQNEGQALGDSLTAIVQDQLGTTPPAVTYSYESRFYVFDWSVN